MKKVIKVSDRKSTIEEKNEFQEYHDNMRRYRRRAFVNPDRNKDHTTYVRPKRDGEVKGKKNKRAAKRARVREMKAAS